ncbi:MAG: 3-deoxy-manno-octulosonate cytidylyltransferase [Bacteroidales bacterium]|nr:3-deoxy-manno-octulosonate cytidylyltransferase [Bacteroidales bacterium]
MKILGIIPARFASTRFPGKPLTIINGKSMIQRVYEQALKAELLTDVVVATDDQRIFDAVTSFSGKVMMTSSEHNSGTDRCCEIIEKIGNQYDAVVNIQGDEPFINPEQIDQIAALISTEESQLASLCKPIKDKDELFDENVVKVVFDKNGNALYFSRQTIPFLRKADRDAASWMEQRTFYKHIGIYAYKVDVLKEIARLPQSGLELSECLEQLRWLENSYEIKMGITEFESYSIDTPQDVEKCLKFFKD